MIGALTAILGIAILLYPIYCIGNNRKFYVLLAEASSAFFMLYVFVTAALYSFNSFTLFAAEWVTVGISAVLLLSAVFLCRKKPDFKIAKLNKEDIAVLITVLVCCGLSIGNFEAYGMGQDEGVYQIEAINILYGKTEWKQSLKEWSSIDVRSKGDYDNYAEWFLLGFDTYANKKEKMDTINEYPFVNVTVTDKGEYSGYFHGIPTYPAFLALSAQIFGIKHMAFGNILLIMCTLLLLNEIMVHFDVKSPMRVLLLLLAGVCPETVWVNMSTLSEAGLTLILISFIYYLVACENEKKQFMALISVTAFSFYHVTIYTMMPMILVCFWGYGLFRKKIKYAIWSVCALIAFWLGYMFMLGMNPHYTCFNYNPGTKFADGHIAPTIFVLLVTAVGIILSIAVGIIGKKISLNREKLHSEKTEKSAYVIVAAGMIVMTVLIVKKAIMDYINFPSEIPTIAAFTVLTGIVIVPSAVLMIIRGRYKLGLAEFTALFAFFWTVLFYSLFMRPSIPHYYYYSRYLAPFIPIAVLAYGVLQKDYKKIGLILVSVAIAICMPFQVMIHLNKDDSRMEWDIIENVMKIAQSEFDENTDVYVDGELLSYFYFPIRACSDANIYYADMKAINKAFEKDKDRKRIYISKEDYSQLEETLYSEKYMQEEDRLDKRVPILGLPTMYEEVPGCVSVTDLTASMKNLTEYSLGRADLKIDSVECSGEGRVDITVSGICPDENNIYCNNGKTYLSFHMLSDKGEDIAFDNARYSIGCLVMNTAPVYFDFEDYFDEDSDTKEAAVQIDLVDEGVTWKSYIEDDLPILYFEKTSEGWREKKE